MTIQLAYKRLLAQLYEIYDDREAANIADMAIEHITGQRKIERILFKDLPVSKMQREQLEKITNELLSYRPVQYILGEAWFMEMKLMVNEHVLIPRPETEELAQWIINDINKAGNKNISLIDIGTGSGCIPVAVKKKIPSVKVSAIDVSHEALQVAELNSALHKTEINLFNIDFLNEEKWNELGKYNIIVSNPPYITQREQTEMRNNVLKYEPHLALFVPDDDALLFYKKIAKFCQKRLESKGSVYVEINETLGKEVVGLFEKSGFSDVIIKKDFQGKDRMVKACCYS